MTLQEQIEELDAVKRLRANPDFHRVFQSMLDAQVERAHQALVSPENTGERLSFARARYVASRELANYLRDKEAALAGVIKQKQAEAEKSPKGLTTPPGGGM
jgi:hypothetical protein